MKELILDIATWRCGGNNGNKLGRGSTQLHNTMGFMCCLGQWSLQLSDEVVKEDIRGYGEPCEIKKPIPLLTYADTVSDDDTWGGESSVIDYFNTDFSDRAMDINDDVTTTPSEKVRLLGELLETEGYTLKTINNEILTNFPITDNFTETL